MELQFDKAKCFRDEEGNWLALKVDNYPKAMQFVYQFKGRFTAVLKRYRKARSTDANAYAWQLMEQIAQAIGSEKWEVYLNMLERYGVFTHVIVKQAAVERVKQEWREVKELGEVTVNGITGIQLQCYYGSSTYDTKEMSRLIDGIVSECKELGIETRTPQELSLLKEEWGCTREQRH